MSLTKCGPEAIAQQLYQYERVYTPIASPAEINEAHLRAYHENGFIAVNNVFNPEEVSEYTTAISDLITNGDPQVIQFEEAVQKESIPPERREGYVRKCAGFVKCDARLKAMSEHPTLIGIIEKLVGGEMKLIQDMALLKPPHVGREKPWHQDMAYFAITPPEKVIGTWTALDPATPENGCMHMIPGSHLAGPKPHYHDRDCQLNDEDVEVNRDVMVPLSPGGVLFFSALVHHGTPPNRSAVRRRAVQLHYAATDCRFVNGDEHLDMFHDVLGYAGCRSHDNGLRPRPITGRPEEI